MSKPRNRVTQMSPGAASILGSGVTRSRGFNCNACGSWFGVFQNATGLNAGHNAIDGQQTFALECPTCTHSDEYSTSEIVELGAPTRPEEPPGHEA